MTRKDLNDQITTVNAPLRQGQTAPTYAYTTDGWRSGKIGGQDPNGVTQNYNFLYDGDELIGEFDPTTNAMVHAYLWGPTGLSMRVTSPCATGGGQVLGYAFDPSGNCVGRHPWGNSAQPVETAQMFDAFGQESFEADWVSNDGYGLSDPIGYKGQCGCYTDHELDDPNNPGNSLVYCHYRYYSPCLGRWLSRDPSGLDGGINCCTFCGNRA